MTAVLSPPPIGGTHQSALVLPALKSRYEVRRWPLPELEADNEVLVQVVAIGLNPVDWKSVDYGFGIPSLPAINGRDFAGLVLRVGPAVKTLQVGDKVFGPSTRYRDFRTSAFQEYAVAFDHCLAKLPENLSLESGAAIGVGAVTAALALSSALGITVDGFSPRELAQGFEGEDEPFFEEPSRTISPNAEREEWVLIWGASSVSGFFASQLALRAGLKVVVAANVRKHGARLEKLGVSVVDRFDTNAALASIKRLTGGKLVYGLDCVGKETTQYVVEALLASHELDRSRKLQRAVVGLAGAPKLDESQKKAVDVRSVPIKTFHTNASVGAALTQLLSSLLQNRQLVLPDVEVLQGGLEAINDGLDRLRAGQLTFGRLVVSLSKS